MNTKPFDLEAALRGEPVWHITRELHVENFTKVGNRVAYTIPEDGDGLYSCHHDGTQHGEGSFQILALKPKTRTIYVNLWNSPSFHYTTHPTEKDARNAKGTTYSGRNYSKLNPEPIAIELED